MQLIFAIVVIDPSSGLLAPAPSSTPTPGRVVSLAAEVRSGNWVTGLWSPRDVNDGNESPWQSESPASCCSFPLPRIRIQDGASCSLLSPRTAEDGD